MRIKTVHMLAVLILACGVLSFWRRPRLGDEWRMSLQSVFWPVASPMRHVGTGLARWVNPPLADARSTDDLQGENRALRAQVANLSKRLDDLQQRLALRERLGDALEHARLFGVAGGDGSHRDVLNLRGGVEDGLAERQPALTADAVVGQVWRVGSAGAQVRLVSDAGFRVVGAFGRWRLTEQGPVFTQVDRLQPLLEGIGGGRMVIRNMPVSELKLAQVAEGDVVVLGDVDWPSLLQGRPIGVVETVGVRRDNPLFGELAVRPLSDLSLLREVWVLSESAR